MFTTSHSCSASPAASSSPFSAPASKATDDLPLANAAPAALALVTGLAPFFAFALAFPLAEFPFPLALGGFCGVSGSEGGFGIAMGVRSAALDEHFGELLALYLALPLPLFAAALALAFSFATPLTVGDPSSEPDKDSTGGSAGISRRCQKGSKKDRIKRFWAEHLSRNVQCCGHLPTSLQICSVPSWRILPMTSKIFPLSLYEIFMPSEEIKMSEDTELPAGEEESEKCYWQTPGTHTSNAQTIKILCVQGSATEACHLPHRSIEANILLWKHSAISGDDRMETINCLKQFC